MKNKSVSDRLMDPETSLKMQSAGEKPADLNVDKKKDFAR
jgi:hypothetical protein